MYSGRPLVCLHQRRWVIYIVVTADWFTRGKRVVYAEIVAETNSVNQKQVDYGRATIEIGELSIPR